MDEGPEFVIGGNRMRISRQIFEGRLAEAVPEAIQKYAVRIGDRRFPVKQAVAVGLGVLRAGSRHKKPSACSGAWGMSRRNKRIVRTNNLLIG